MIKNKPEFKQKQMVETMNRYECSAEEAKIILRKEKDTLTKYMR